MFTDRVQLVAACQRKDSRALKQLYDELAPAMLGVCMRYTRSRDEAQDLLHDGFIKAFENIGKLKEPSALDAWVRQIMVNVSINYVMRRNKVVYCDMENLTNRMDAEDAQVSDGNDGAPDFDEVDARVEEVVSAVQSLPDRYRLVFNMRAVEELDYDEIAKRLEQPLSTVRSYMSRARQMILKNLKKKGNRP